MTSFIVLIILVVLLSLYYVGNRKRVREQCEQQEFVQSVEAGSLDKVSVEQQRAESFYAPKRKLYKKDGTEIDLTGLIRIVSNGDCMFRRNIVKGTQLYVRAVQRGKAQKENLKEGDILLIQLPDTGVYKIREFEKSNDDNTLKTFYYNTDGSHHNSSNPHRIEDVVGVVKYRI